MAKCPKCENDSFKIVTYSESYCFVQCRECGNAVGVLEDINFNKEFNIIADNQTRLDKLIDFRTSEIKKELGEQHDKINYILDIVERLNQKLD